MSLDQGMISCEKCGQKLWVIERSEQGGMSLCGDHTKGWKYDFEYLVWYPTDRSQKQYDTARFRIGTPQALPEDQDIVKYPHHRLLGRNANRSQPNTAWTESPERANALRLPTRIKCIQCGQLNRVASMG